MKINCDEKNWDFLFKYKKNYITEISYEINSNCDTTKNNQMVTKLKNSIGNQTKINLSAKKTIKHLIVTKKTSKPPH